LVSGRETPAALSNEACHAQSQFSVTKTDKDNDDVMLFTGWREFATSYDFEMWTRWMTFAAASALVACP
jgi:hypothetical protein